ncbi:MAG: AAA family ATPase [Chloroflexota bacterium]
MATLNEAGLVVAQRCLTAEQLLDATLNADVVLVSSDLHRLNQEALAALTAHGRPLLLLGSVPGFDAAARTRVVALPMDTDPDQVCQALRALLSGQPVAQAVTELAPKPAEVKGPPTASDGGSILAGLTVVISSHGSPGCTTVALNLATALGAGTSTLLVDADVVKPSVVAHIDGDPTRNIYLLARAEPHLQREWDRALDQETQTIHARSPQAAVLCGIPKPDMRAAVTPRFIEGLLPQLQQRYGRVVIDAGAVGSDQHIAVQQLLVRSAARVLLVLTADILGVWRAQQALRALDGQGLLDRDRLALVVNRCSPRHHHSRAEIERVLGLPVAAIIPEDTDHARCAVQAQQPVVLRRRSRAGRALLGLAERFHGGDILLPPEQTGERRRSPLHWPGMRFTGPRVWPGNSGKPRPVAEGGGDSAGALSGS